MQPTTIGYIEGKKDEVEVKPYKGSYVKRIQKITDEEYEQMLRDSY